MDKHGWIRIAERLPTAEDADAWGCVVVWHELQGMMFMNPKMAAENQFVTHWQRTIAPPEEYAQRTKGATS